MTTERGYAAVLAEHQWHHTRDTHCSCGFRTPLAQLAVDGWLTHVAAALLASDAHAAELRRAEARALREAAERLDQDETFPPPDKHDSWWRDGWESGVVDACALLRDRAAAKEAGL